MVPPNIFKKEVRMKKNEAQIEKKKKNVFRIVRH